MKILRDLREKHAWRFEEAARRWPELNIQVERRHLQTGDYTVEGLESSFCVERKSVKDFRNTLTQENERFWREFERMEQMGAVIIVEAPLETYTGGSRDVINQLKFIKQPYSVIREMMILIIKFPGIRWRFCKSPEAAEMAAFMELYKAAKAAGIV